MKGKIINLEAEYNIDGYMNLATMEISQETAKELVELNYANNLKGVEIDFKPCVNDTIDSLTYAIKFLEQTHIEPPTRSKDFWEKEFEKIRQFCCEPKTKVIFNEPATVLYKDGKKYVCKCDKEDKFSEELGLALCLLKSFGVSYSDFEQLLKGAKRQNKDKTLK